MKTIVGYALVAISLGAPATPAQMLPSGSRSAGVFEASGVECISIFCGPPRAYTDASAVLSRVGR